MKAYFIVSVQAGDPAKRALYDGYIQKVRPVVERHGGKYLVRTERIGYLSAHWQPDRLIVVEFPDREALDRCFASDEYREIMHLREGSVQADAVIVDGI